MAIEDDAATNAGANRDVDQPRLATSCAPCGFRQCARISVVFQRDLDSEEPAQISHRVLPAPAGKEVQIAKFAGNGIDRAGRSHADSSNLDAGALLHFAKHADDAFKAR